MHRLCIGFQIDSDKCERIVLSNRNYGNEDLFQLNDRL